MYLVIAYAWQKSDPEVVEIVAKSMKVLAFEARQKIAGGGPIVLANYSEKQPAKELSTQLSAAGIPSFTIDTSRLQEEQSIYQADRFELREHTLLVETAGNKPLEIDFQNIEFFILSTCRTDQLQTSETTTKRKFSMGKTLLAGGIPMTKKVKKTTVSTAENHYKTLCLYSDNSDVVSFSCNTLDYSGLESARQLTRELNFKSLHKELLRLAPHVDCDERLLNRASQVKILGPSLNPDQHLQLAFEVLYQCHKRLKNCEAGENP